MRLIRSITIAVALAGALTGCDDATGPTEPVVFALERIGVHSLPLLLRETTTSRSWLDAERLELRSDGVAILSWIIRIEPLTGDDMGFEYRAEEWTYRRGMAHLELSRDVSCPPDASCLGPVTLEGTIVGERLLLEGPQATGVNAVTREYRRVGIERD